MLICDDCGEKAFECDCLESSYSPTKIPRKKNHRLRNEKRSASLLWIAVILEILGVAMFCAIWVILWMGTGD